MREPKLDLETADNQKAILTVECPECGNKSKFLLDGISPGTPVLCNCGGVLSLSADGLESIRQQYDNMKKTKD